MITLGGRAYDSTAGAPSRKLAGQAVKPQIHHRSSEQSKHLADDQATDDADAKGSPQFRASSATQGQRQTSEHGGHGGHHDGTKTLVLQMDEGGVTQDLSDGCSRFFLVRFSAYSAWSAR